MSGIDFQRIFEAVPGLFVILKPDVKFTILGASDAYLRAAFTSREKIVGRGIFEVFDSKPDDPVAVATMANLRASLARVMATKAPDTMEVQRYDRKRPKREGGAIEERFWSPVNSPVLSDTGEIQYVIHRVEDITELVRVRRAEQFERTKLAETNSQFQAIYDQGLFAGKLNLEGTVIDLNRACLEQCGYVREEMMGKPFWECGWWNRSPGVQAWIKAGVGQAIRGVPFRGETIYFLADGTERVADFNCMPIRDAEGEVVVVFPTAMDITERVRAEENLRATEILESIAEGFFALDRDWRFTYVNREGELILGRTRDDLIGRVIWDEYKTLEGSEFAAIYRAAMHERKPGSLTAYFAEHDRWYEVHTYPAPGGISAYFRNVTAEKMAAAERAQLEAASEQQRRVYETALSNTPDLVYIFDLSHRFVYANEALLRMWGNRRETAIGKTLSELGYEPWHAEMHDHEIDQVISTRQPIRGEVPFVGTGGRRVYDYIFVPVFGPGGDVVAIAGTTRDITDRQQAEQAIREQAARLADADRAKDEFLATLAHELRNPLAPLRNSLALLRMSGAGDAKAAPMHEMMERQINHLVRLVDDLLEMSRISRGAFALRNERVEVAAIVRNAVETSQPLIEAAQHALTVSLPAAPLWVEGDPVRLAQILANLLNNAAKYTDDGGRIAIEARRDDDGVAITVRDNGTGIEPDALPRMFEMFSRGDRVSGRGGSGLGIGLALARRLADMHGGKLDARSEGPGKGSEFTLHLTLADNQAPGMAIAGQPDAAISQKRILVVDDNRDAADSLAMVLRFLGADVRIARDGAAALEAFGAYDPAVVLLDIGMPGMDGYEVARNIRARDPDRRVAIVALTGWGQDKDRRLAQEAGFDHHLIKPADIGALQALLSSLDGQDGAGSQGYHDAKQPRAKADAEDVERQLR